MEHEIQIGTSGFSYGDWKGPFYPATMSSKDFLSFYAQTFSCTEVNGSFYSLPRISTVENWSSKVPTDFKFCPKMSKYLTHIKRLKEPDEPLARFFGIFEAIKDKLGPVLVQLPPSLKFDYEVADYFFSLLKKSYNFYDFVLEVRHESWLADEAVKLLAKYDIALVISQSGKGFPYAEILTSKNIYLRLHGPGKLYDSSYPEESLQELAGKIKGWYKNDHNIWVFFNNAMNGHGRENAIRLKQILNLNSKAI